MTAVVYEGVEYEVRDDESVLDALIRGGAEVAFSCKKGSCHCCILRALEGDPGDVARRGLRQSLADSGHFKPCVTHPTHDMVLATADASQLSVQAVLAAREEVSPGLFKLSLEPELTLDWRPGQYVNVRRPDGMSRSYSISSIGEEDYFLELHVRRVEDGEVSRWLCDEVEEYTLVELQGPMGSCTYDEALASQPLLLVGTGAGVPPLVGIVRDALRSGHTAPITLVHGARDAADLAMHDTLTALASAHDNLSVVACVSGDTVPDWAVAGRVTAHAFNEDLAGAALFLCGNPDMVFDARARAILAGVRRADVYADPFIPSHPFWPDDRGKIAGIPPYPELWAALEQGPRLRTILEDFYGRVYEDPILHPFFHNATLERAISKQFSFLRDLFTGERQFFGLRPFNAHHWMIISDDLFDYREALFETVLREHDFPEPLLRSWMALHEQFRREIVKDAPRGLIVDGKEHHLEGYSIENLDIDMVCDGCGEEMLAGERGRLHRRTGQLFCMRCGGRALNP